MKVSCPVPLQGPWSPVGYQVVETEDANVPGAQVCPPTSRPEGREQQPRPPKSPVGYRITQVADEQIPTVQAVEPPLARPAKRPPARRPAPQPPWAGIAFGVGFGILCLIALVSLSLSASGPDMPEPPVEVAAGDAGNGAGEVILPQAANAPPAQKGGPLAVKAQPLAAAVPVGDACPPARRGKAAGDRETFGTTVAFARNANEAARAAAEERKLVFHLHVSGNFEEARFT
jgi:hypothetical protein